MVIFSILFIINLISCEMILNRVIVVTRHGDRTPLFDPLTDHIWNCSLPSEVSISPIVTRDPSPTMFNRLFLIENQVPETLAGNCMVGQLTELGMSQHHSLGQRFRSAYVGNLLSDTYNSKEVYIETTSYTRTIQSAESQMEGLFPKCNAGETIKMYQQDQGKTDMYLNWFSEPVSCPRIMEIFQKIESSEKWKNFQKSEEYYKNYLIKLLDYDPDKFEWIYLHDSFDCMRSHNLSLPKGITLDDVNHVENNLKYEFYENYYVNDEVIRLGIGSFLKRLIMVMEKDNYYKFLLYSAHDVTVGPLAYALGLSEDDSTWEWPIFAANLVFELYRDDKAGRKFVKVLYNGKERTVRGCDLYCELNDFVYLVGKYIPTDWQKECEIGKQRRGMFNSPKIT